MNTNHKGALFMAAGMTAYTLNDTLVKLLGASLPLSQILVLRGFLATLGLVFLARMLKEPLRVSGRRATVFMLVRTAFEVIATYFFLSALLVMPIANATAVMQALPLTVTLAAAVMLAEPVGWRRSLAIAAGFMGMLLIVRPGADGFAEGTFYVLLAVIFITGRDMITRIMPDGIPAMSLAISAGLGVMLLGVGLSSSEQWVAIEPSHAVLLVGAAILILSGYLCSVLSMRFGDVSFTAPFRYTGLLVALGAGLLLFDQWPDGWTLIGAAIVVGAGLFTLFRTNQAKKGAQVEGRRARN